MQLDAIFTNADFTTLDARRPRARRIGVVAWVIVGLDEELDGCRADVVHDLGGAVVVPGLNDAHHHLSRRGQDLRACDVSPAVVGSLDELYAALRAHAAGLPADAWVRAHGFDEHKLGGLPTIQALDAATDGRPLWLESASRHYGMVNTESFRRMGHTDLRDVPDVDGGWVQRDADGAATGVLGEQALTLALDLVRPEPFEDFVDSIAQGCRAALADGLTSVTEPGIAGRLTGNAANDLAAFQEARARGLLGVRMTVFPEISALHELDHTAGGPGFGLDLGLRSGLGDDTLRVSAVKIISDGALTSRTAAVCCDYAGRPGDRGLLLHEEMQLRSTIRAAHAAGWQVATHAIGDRAVEIAVDAYEQAQAEFPRTDPRHRIEHCGLTTDATIARIKRAGIVPVPQAQFLAELGDSYVAALGEERKELLYRQRSFLDAGIEVPGSSDCPVVSGSPLKGIHALVNRVLPGGEELTPAERLTPLEALRAYTVGSAYADHQEHRKGTLTRGRLADLTVLSDDVTAVPRERIQDIEVVATVVGGETRYGAERIVRA